MSQWASTSAKRVLTAIFKIGWRIKRQAGSHKILAREGWPNVVFVFHDGETLGPKILSRVAQTTGLHPDDL